jgi:putative endonuclease
MTIKKSDYKDNYQENRPKSASNGMWYTYLLQSKKNKRWYTGCAGDLRKRFKEHNKGVVGYTKGRGPFNLIYYEACLNKSDAFDRERYLKTGMGRKYLKNRLKRFLFLTG